MECVVCVVTGVRTQPQSKDKSEQSLQEKYEILDLSQLWYHAMPLVGYILLFQASKIHQMKIANKEKSIFSHLIYSNVFSFTVLSQRNRQFKESRRHILLSHVVILSQIFWLLLLNMFEKVNWSKGWRKCVSRLSNYYACGKQLMIQTMKKQFTLCIKWVPNWF